MASGRIDERLVFVGLIVVGALCYGSFCYGFARRELRAFLAEFVAHRALTDGFEFESVPIPISCVSLPGRDTSDVRNFVSCHSNPFIRQELDMSLLRATFARWQAFRAQASRRAIRERISAIAGL